MAIEICSVGGYTEFGRNMTAVKVDDEVVLLDMGIHLENYIRFTEDEDLRKISPKQLIDEGAIPDISVIQKWTKDVIAIIPTHAHLDHIGAIPFIAKKFKNATIYCTQFTKAVIETTLNNERISLPNPIKPVTTNSIHKLSPNIKAEFINMTHSTPQTVMVALHTRYGIIVYANDFKFDLYPTLGKKPDFKKLVEIGKDNVIALVCDSTYAGKHMKTPSESVAREMLRDVMIATDSRNKAIIISTFSSHIARIKSIVDFSKRINRKVIFLGRSLAKYIEAAETSGIVSFSKEHEIVKYPRQIKRRLARMTRQEIVSTVFIATGHQGEPKSVLSRIASGILPFPFEKEDHIVFSCTVIPTETNQKNREEVEKKLKEKGLRLFRDIHVSGHAAREDLRDLINFLKPKNVIPAHGNIEMLKDLRELAIEMGYKDKNILVMREGEFRKIL